MATVTPNGVQAPPQLDPDSYIGRGLTAIFGPGKNAMMNQGPDTLQHSGVGGAGLFAAAPPSPDNMVSVTPPPPTLYEQNMANGQPMAAIGSAVGQGVRAIAAPVGSAIGDLASGVAGVAMAGGRGVAAGGGGLVHMGQGLFGQVVPPAAAAAPPVMAPDVVSPVVAAASKTLPAMASGLPQALQMQPRTSGSIPVAQVPVAPGGTLAPGGPGGGAPVAGVPHKTQGQAILDAMGGGPVKLAPMTEEQVNHGWATLKNSDIPLLQANAQINTPMRQRLMQLNHLNDMTWAQELAAADTPSDVAKANDKYKKTLDLLGNPNFAAIIAQSHSADYAK